MIAMSRFRFDVQALRRLAGQAVFQRGEDYHAEGLVTVLAVDPERVRAQVEGTETYRTELAGGGATIDGHCSCPAFADSGFCKHMVATALAVNAGDGGHDPEGPQALERIRGHLAKKGVDALVAMILDLAEQDDELFERLDFAAMQDGLSGAQWEERLRQALDHATDAPHYIDYRAAPGWASGVVHVLDALSEQAQGDHAASTMRLAERAIERIEDRFEEIDDSDGHLVRLLGIAKDLHLTAARKVRPDPTELARYLFARETDSDFQTFAGALEDYSDVLGQDGIAEYRRLATEAWDMLAAGRENDDEGSSSASPHAVMQILDVFAAREGDLDRRIALRTRDLSSAWHYVILVEFCKDNGRNDQALHFAEQGLALFEHRSEERLVLLTADLLEKAGRPDDAQGRLWDAFTRTPSPRLYEPLRRLGGEAARDGAIRYLEAVIAKGERLRFVSPSAILIDILIGETMFDAAWAAARTHGAAPEQKLRLAEAGEASHPREALGVYSERVEALVSGGVPSGYPEAAAFVDRMARLHSPAEHAAYRAGLKARHGRKRNFMALLR